MKLTMIIPTRGRPNLLLETLAHTILNVGRDDTRILICVDDDDKSTIECLGQLPTDDRVKVSIKPREDSRGEKYNRALAEAEADVYLLAVDCAPILTSGFDQAIINAARLFPDGIGCVYTPMANASFPGYQAPTAGLVAKLGYIYNPEYPFWFVDHELDDICRMIGRYVCVDVDVQTSAMRPAKTIRLRDLEFWTRYFDLMTMERRLKARAIINAVDFECPQWMKAIMRDWYQPIEARSYWINNNVRNQAAEIEAQRGETAPPDEGYLRAKAKADKKLIEVFAALKRAA